MRVQESRPRSRTRRSTRIWEIPVYAKSDHAIPRPAGRATRSHLPRGRPATGCRVVVSTRPKGLVHRRAPRPYARLQQLVTSVPAHLFLAGVDLRPAVPPSAIQGRLRRSLQASRLPEEPRLDLGAEVHAATAGELGRPARSPTGRTRAPSAPLHDARRRPTRSQPGRRPLPRRLHPGAMAARPGVSRRPPFRTGAHPDQGPGLRPRGRVAIRYSPGRLLCRSGPFAVILDAWTRLRFCLTDGLSAILMPRNGLGAREAAVWHGGTS